jgi:acyl-coenzyme A synthetase/AMP-(fatty) acid ligase/acyl carrier protein
MPLPPGLHRKIPARPGQIAWLPEHRTVWQRFDAVAAQRADQLALDDGKDKLSFIALKNWSDHIAADLLTDPIDRRNGIPATAAICLPLGSPVIAANLAVFQAGQTLLSLDPEFEDVILRQLLIDSEARWLLTQRRFFNRFEQLGLDRLRLVDIDELRARAPKPQRTNPREACYLIYTSGSTGTPKAILHNASNLRHWARSSQRLHAIGPDDRIGLTFPINFGGSMKVITQALLNGASLHPFDLRLQGLGQLQSWLEHERISKFQATPTLLRQLYQHMEAGRTFNDLRLVYTGGETVHPDIVTEFWQHFGEHTWLRTGGGASESLMIAECFMTSDYDAVEHGVPFGFIAPGYQVDLVDPDGKSVPPGETGEIKVTSDFLAAGYWKDAELTAAKFGHADDGRRSYRTGDLGQFAEGPLLIHKGRADRMVKVRGFRVELDGIEAELLNHPRVGQAAALLSESRPAEIWAYLEPLDAQTLELQEVRAFLASKLPGYMLPARMLIMTQLPLTSSDKVDRTQLPALHGQRPEINIRFEAPQTPQQQDLAAIWARVLDVNPVGLHDTFIDLGGDSLKAMQIQNLVRRELAFDLMMIDLMDCPTVAALATRIQKREAGDEIR